MEFKKYLEIFGMFNYFVPKDKEQQMYDFYMFANLRGVTNKKNVHQFGGVAGEKPYYEPSNFEPGNLETSEQQADYMLEEVGEKLLPELKISFLNLIEKAVASEIKYAIINNDEYILSMLIKKENPELHAQFFKFLMDLESRDPLKFDPYEDNEDDDVFSKLRRDDLARGLESIDYYEAAKKVFTEFGNFMRIAKTLFEKVDVVDWNENYGGKAWSNIVDAYFQLKYASNTNKLIVAIDHVYDLEHNTGSIFTKDDSYSKLTNKKRDFSWIKKALDYKSQVSSIKDLLDKVSPLMKKLASRIIHIKNIT